jgi:nucleotide sugar dehydrogenase
MRRGLSPVGEPKVREAFDQGFREKRFFLSSNGIKMSELSEFKIIAVPVGTVEDWSDLTAMKTVSRTIGSGLKLGDIVAVQSSVPVGTTETVVCPILEKESGLRVEEEFGLIYSPQRLAEGHEVEDIEDNYPAIVSGMGQKSLEVGSTLYGLIAKRGVLKMSSVRAAEMEKLCEGIYRDVNIALSNELSHLCEAADIDFWEVRMAANSQPYSNLHKPGTGVGGLCIPFYSTFVIRKAIELGIEAEIISVGRRINESMPEYTVNQALRLLTTVRKSTKGAKCAILGLAFRGDIPDSRFSPTYAIVALLRNKGLSVNVHDPYIFSDTLLDSDVALTDSIEKAVKGAQLIIVSTDHSQYRKLNGRSLGTMVGEPFAIFDGRGVLEPEAFDRRYYGGIGRIAR